MKIALFAAFPHELSHIVKNARPLPGNPPFPAFSRKHGGIDLLAVETGMSRANVQTAFEYVRKRYRPDLILSVGFGGALFYRVDIGQLIFATRYFFLTREGVVELPQLSPGKNNPQQLAFNAVVAGRIQQKITIKEGCFVSLSDWTTKSHLKRCMPKGIAFPVCDRETIHLAKMAFRSGTTFFAIRSITDTLEQDIPKELFNVTDENGMYRLSLALRRLLCSPSLLVAGLRLGRNASRASKNLSSAVDALLEVLSADGTGNALLACQKISTTRFF